LLTQLKPLSKSNYSYKGEIVREYLAKYPELSTRGLARLLVKELPLDFTSETSSVGIVRFHRGEHGQHAAKTLIGMRTEKERRQAIAWNKLPKSDYEPQVPFKIPTGNNRILILSDIHIPYHDEGALSTALEWGYKNNPNAIILNGDTMDMYQASRFVKDRRLRDLAGEIEMTRDFLRQLKDEFACPIYFKIGNHEDRWETYLKTCAPELLGIADFELQNVLRFGELGVTLIKSQQVIKAGGLNIMHGHEFGSSVFSPVNAARGLYMRSKTSTIVGHHHQTSEHSEKDLNGNVVTCWSMGSLCGLSPDYMPYNKWNHGFAWVETSGEDYEVRNLRIIKNKVR